MPVTWAEVADAVARRRPELLTFNSETAVERLERRGDLFRPVLELEQRLPG
jgi:bifunctional non-homologous end joining protein LigD